MSRQSGPTSGASWSAQWLGNIERYKVGVWSLPDILDEDADNCFALMYPTHGCEAIAEARRWETRVESDGLYPMGLAEQGGKTRDGL